MNPRRISNVRGVFLCFIGAMLSLGVSGFASAAKKPSTPTSAWIFPQPASADSFSTKETKRFEKGWSDFTSGKAKKARKAWLGLLKKHPHSTAALTGLGYLDFEANRPADAVSKLQAAVQYDPKSIPALETLSRYFTSKKDYEKAYRYTISLVEARPGDAQNQSRLEGLRLLVTEDWIAQARAERAKAKWPEAEQFYLKALSTAPELASLVRELGDVYVYEGKWKDAENTYLRALRLDPMDREAKKKLAEVYMSSNQPAKAETLLKELSAGSSRDEEVQSMLDKILAHSDPVEVALAQVRQKTLITRGDFGAMLALQFPFLREFVKSSPVILTDLKSHWGSAYLPLVAGLDLIPAYPNHQFRPNAAIHREEIATALDRLLILVSRRPKVDARRFRIVDVPRTNSHRPAIDTMVSLGWMPLDSQNRFHPLSGMSGPDAMKILVAVEQYLR